MKDNEITKAKEHFQYGISHDIFKEPVLSYAKTVLWAFEEINCQKAEIKSLTEKLEALGDPLQDAQYKIAEQQAEIERLQAEQMMADGYAEALEQKAKAEAIKDFAERLKAFVYYADVLKDAIIDESDINDLVKEMVGDA